MRRIQKGFTLIELIMVIVILGILAAFALPRFADMSAGAREATIEGLAASMKSASAIAHSQFLVEGNPVTIDGSSFTLLDGYPAVADILDLAGATIADYPNIATQDVARVATTTAGEVAYGFSTTCMVTYTEAMTGVAAASDVAVTASIGGC